MKKYVNEQIYCVELTDQQKQSCVKRMRQMEVDRVIMFTPRSFQNNEQRENTLAILRENISFFQQQGFEIIVNVLTIGFGETLEPQLVDDEKITKSSGDNYQKLLDFYGNTMKEAYCPSDPTFVESICGYLKDIVRMGAKIILLDDDLCMNVRPGLGCACDNHLKLLQERLGESVRREELEDKIYCGEPNKYRDAWMDIMGDTLRDFCRRLRKAVDEIDPSVRLGQMLSYTNWDLEGADALELCRILAGNTRPIMRLSGAPYWVSGFQRFGDMGMEMPAILEFLRLQESWCREYDMEIMDENDNFPRPRQHCPAALCESYDLCLTASGNIQSFLHECQYEREYPEGAEFATGYEEAHVRNRPVREWLIENFKGNPAGIRVYEAMHKVRYMTFPKPFVGQKRIMESAFSPAQSFLANLSIPTVLSGRTSCGVAFGILPRLMSEQERNGNLILDAVAAQEMRAMGIDVGYSKLRTVNAPNQEYFPEEEITIPLYYFSGIYYEMELNSTVQVLSWFRQGEHLFPASYIYENADGQRFLVYSFDSGSLRQDSDTLCSRNRQRQLLRVFDWLQADMPAKCEGHPGLYVLCKKDKKDLCVAMCNFSADWIYQPVVQLNQEYHTYSSPQSIAILEGRELRISEDIPPYGFVCFRMS